MNAGNTGIPRGIEVLVKKASVDPEFRILLLSKRTEAAELIGLPLDPAEAMMLRAATEVQLEAVIARTTVPQEHRRAFLGKAAAAMLAAVGVMGPGAAASLAIGKGRIGGGGGGGIRVDVPRNVPAHAPRRRFPNVDPRVEQGVIDAIAQELVLAGKQVSWEKELVKDLKIDAKAREAIRKALETSFGITIPAATFATFKTVEDATHYIDVATARRRRNDALARRAVVDAIAKEMKIARNRIGGNMRLEADLKMTTAQRARLKRRLAADLRLYIAWDSFKRLVTVDDVVDHIAETIEKQKAAVAATAAKRKKESKSSTKQINRSKIPPAQMTFGIRPDVPIMGGSGGIRPDRPPKGPLIPQRDPFREAEELRRKYGQ